MKKVFTIDIQSQNKTNILEKIKKNTSSSKGFFHIVSLNPEICVEAYQNKDFNRVIATAQVRIVDGVGVAKAAQLAGVDIGERITGVDLMESMLKMAHELSLGVLFIGGKANLALSLAECFRQKYPRAQFFGTEGIRNIQNPTQKELEELHAIVTARTPQLVFVSFGSPHQELWIEANKDLFKNAIVMGVGGAFDFLGGVVPRAPHWLQKAGGEWLFRLVLQPWRWRRQLRLFTFCWLVLTGKIVFVQSQ